MAPSSGHLLVPKAMRVVKFALSKTKTFLRDRLASTKNTSTTTTHAVLNPLPIRPSRHPLTLLRQSRPFTTARLRTPAPKSTSNPTRSSLPASTTARRAGTPFASTLRPNLTGGALPRTSGGYSLGGARHFSHTPAAPAQVLQNVSAACRAFWLSGHKARFDGLDPRSGDKTYRSVSPLQETARRARATEWQGGAPGARVEFAIAPTVTALTSAGAGAAGARSAPQTLRTAGLLDGLAGDFARALADLAAVLADLKRLAVLGDLPVGLVPAGAADGQGGARLCVRFPGCDAESVEKLCLEVGVRRGVVRAPAPAGEVGADVKMALLFPFAPGSAAASVAGGDEGGCFRHADKVDWRHMMSPTQEGSLTSRATSEHAGSDEGFVDADVSGLRILDSPSGCSSLRDSDYEDDDDLRVGAHDAGGGGAADYDGLEGIYRFLSECEGARR